MPTRKQLIWAGLKVVLLANLSYVLFIVLCGSVSHALTWLLFDSCSAHWNRWCDIARFWNAYWFFVAVVTVFVVSPLVIVYFVFRLIPRGARAACCGFLLCVHGLLGLVDPLVFNRLIVEPLAALILIASTLEFAIGLYLFLRFPSRSEATTS